MGQKVGKKMNDGNKSQLGLKQDRFRNSDFEFEPREIDRFAGVSRATINTINGSWAENRGRRGDDVREDNPFENGELSNWNRRKGWDEYYEPHDRVERKHGGALLHHDFGDLEGQRGKGPRGYVRPDSRIFEDVCELLTSAPDVDASEMEVNVEEGVVTLTGQIEDRNMKRQAGRLVDLVSGVKDLHNLLEINQR